MPARPAKFRGYEIAPGFGFGRQIVHSSPATTTEGYHINYQHDYPKSPDITLVKHVDSLTSLMLNVGYSYDYEVDYTASKVERGLSVGVDGGTELYTVWQGIICARRQVFHHHRWTATAFAGCGMELYFGHNGYTTETPEFNNGPYMRYVYTHLPTEVNRRPIFLLSGGADVAYQLKWLKRRLSLFGRITGKYSFRPFLIDRVRIENAVSTQVATTEMTGSTVMLFGGIQCRLY